MTDEDKPRSPIKDAGWLALFLIVIGVIWFAQGGPKRLTSMSPFLETSKTGQTSQISNEEKAEEKTGEGQEEGKEKNTISLFAAESPYKGKISLSASYARNTNPQEEYVEIRNVSGTESILITGWTLTGRERLDIAIGQGAYLPYSGRVNPQNQIYLEPNSRAVVATGKSPIGTSFRLNICTGYFNQFQKFFPSLSKECPAIPEEDVPLNYPDACFDFVKRLSRCEIPLNMSLETQFAIGNDCILLLSERANYNGCVNIHKNEEDFYKKEWRIYLGRDNELWSNQRERIILRDQQGRIIDEVSY